MAVRSQVRTLSIRLLGIQGAELDNPWDYVQGLVEQRLHEYLGVEASDVAGIVIVGAWRGHEVARLLARYPNCNVVCYEPLAHEFNRLVARYRSEPRVRCVMAAVSDTHGATASFHVPEVVGTGSLLPPVEGGRTPSIGTTEVTTVRLDDDPNVADVARVDCLWIDTQGSELHVLRGASELLTRTHAVFAEVAAGDVPYVGGATFLELDQELSGQGFGLVSLGLDPQTGEGNALWSRRFFPQLPP